MTHPPQPRLPLRRRRGWAHLRLLRPLALLSGVGVVVVLAFIVARGDPVWHETVRLALVIAAVLAAASILNDLIDIPHDRYVYLWRPMPSGLVRVDVAVRLAVLAVLIALILAATLGWRPFVTTVAAIFAAGAYSARFRNTPLSWLPYSVTFALIPPWVAEALDRFDDVLWWSFPVGAMVGLAVHLLLKLPDYERDDTDGTRNVLHWLTIDFAVPVTWGAIGAFIVIAVASANIENLRSEWLVPPAVVLIVLTLGFMTALFLRVTERRLLVQRWVLIPALLALAVGWYGSIVP